MNERIFSLVYIIIIFEKNCPLKNGVDQFYPLPPKMADPPPLKKIWRPCMTSTVHNLRRKCGAKFKILKFFTSMLVFLLSVVL
jgi:hypothetical protein